MYEYERMRVRMKVKEERGRAMRRVEIRLNKCVCGGGGERGETHHGGCSEPPSDASVGT